jgi:hypothetical protein
MSAPTRQAEDLLLLGDDWEAQSSSLATPLNRATSTLNNGDIDLSDTYGSVDNVSVPYKYVGAETAFAAALTAASARVGEVTAGDFIVLGYGIDYSVAGAGESPVITFTARDKPGTWEPDYSCDPIYDASVVLPTFPCGIPDLLENSDSDSSLTSETYTIAAQFGVDMDDVGEEIAIGLYGAEETLALKVITRSLVENAH